MKKFTLLLVLVLSALYALAQDKTVVTPPEGLVTEQWLLMAERYDSQEYTVDATQRLYVGIQGDDVYVQGLNMYLPDTWVKGVRTGSMITFAANQYYGELSDGAGTGYSTYFAGCDVKWFDGVSGLMPQDVTFAVNEAGDQWTTEQVLVVNTKTDAIEGFDYLKSVVITKPHDVAASPKAPTIYQFMPYDESEGYGGVSLNFPPVDVDGNALMTEKLSYVVYKDVNHEISPITFPAWIDEETTQDMTEIPYDFTDDYNILAGGYAAYFYEPSASWNRIGVKAIYTGGGETRESETTWMLLAPYADEAAVFDFNALDKATTPVSTSSSHDGDITADKVMTAGNVTLTISPSTSGGNTANRFWVDYNLQAIQLRLYGGTLTFQVPDGYTMEQIFVYASDWNDYSYFDSGDFADGIWTGSAQKVVLTIDDGKPNTKLNKLAVVVKEATTGVSRVCEMPVETLRTYDLQGREVAPGAKGLSVSQVRMSDGTLKTVKVVR